LCGEKLARDFADFYNHKKAQEELARERALDKYRFFVLGLTIATTLY